MAFQEEDLRHRRELGGNARRQAGFNQNQNAGSCLGNSSTSSCPSAINPAGDHHRANRKRRGLTHDIGGGPGVSTWRTLDSWAGVNLVLVRVHGSYSYNPNPLSALRDGFKQHQEEKSSHLSLSLGEEEKAALRSLC